MALLLLISTALPQALLLLIGVACLLLYLFLQPPEEPKHIPAVPFWVSLLPLIKDVDQQVIYNTYIRDSLLQHGAIKIFFGSQWNVLVQRPAFLGQVFKREDLYQKSGNQKKIPGSVLASFLGDNIISSHGEVWKLYQDIMKPGLQEGWSMAPMYENAILLLDHFKQTSRPLPVQEPLQRYTIANLVRILLHIDVDMNHEKTLQLSQMQSKVKSQIFRPIFMSFPFLDTWGFKSREKARRDAAQFTDHLVSMIKETWLNKSIDDHQEHNDVGYRLVSAWKQNRITHQQLRDNATIVFVAGQENPQLALLSTLYLLAKHPEAQERLHAEVIAAASGDQPTEEQLRNMPYLTSCIYESLRLYPPIGQLINRLATIPLVLGPDTIVPQGTYIGYNSYATNRDPALWGPNADDFVPTRWGGDSSASAVATSYRRRRARAEFLTFHGGRRACLGERFAVLQLKVTLVVMVRSLRWGLDPLWLDRMTPAGPLAPRGLRLRFERRV